MLPHRIILVRHGETDWNKERRFMGQSDLRLNEKGLEQAHKAARLLKGEQIDLLLSSDLLRAVATARVIAGFHAAELTLTPNLREINFGLWEGLTFEEIQRHYPVESSRWLLDPLTVEIPGGETTEQLKKRVMEAWDYAVLNSEAKDTVAIVAHGGSLRILYCCLTGLELSRQWEFNPGHGEAVILQRQIVKQGDGFAVWHLSSLVDYI